MDTTDFSRQADKWNQRYGLKEAVWSLEPNRFLVEELKGVKPGKALDLGAGEGRHAIWLAEHNWQVTAIDFAEQGIKRGKERAANGNLKVEWICADLADYVLPVASYDLAIMLYLHTPEAERKAIIKRTISALSTGGHFIYIGHDLANLSEGQGGPQDPAVLCSVGDILAELSGFSIPVAETRRRSVDQETGHGDSVQGVAVDTVVHAIKTANCQ